MNGFGGHIASGGSDTIWNGIIMIDPVLGDDATGERNVINKPFKTLAAADAVYQEGDLIEVLPGTLTLTTSHIFTKAFSVHLNFIEGAKIFGDFSLPLLNNNNALVPYHIYGRGEFRNDNTVFYASGVATLSGDYWVHGAKKISCGQATFVMGPQWWNIENVDEIYTERVNGSCFSFVNNPAHEEEQYGNIKNCPKIGDLNFNSLGMGVSSQMPNNTLYVENCNFMSGGQAAISIPQGDNQAVFQNCTFKSLNNRAAVVVRKAEFNNCHFVSSHPSLEAVLVFNNDENNMPIFTDCTFRKTAGGPAIRTNEPASFYGVNRFFTETGLEAATGNGDHVNKNHGTILANSMDTVVGIQSFGFIALENVPTVGETYTIAAPDGASISYVVQAADTRTEIINALETAWDAEVTAEPDGFFAKFDNKVKAIGPSLWRILAFSIDADDNLSPENFFTFSTDGSDSILLQVGESNSFPWKGSGKFIVDENLIVPNY